MEKDQPIERMGKCIDDLFSEEHSPTNEKVGKSLGDFFNPDPSYPILFELIQLAEEEENIIATGIALYFLPYKSSMLN